MNDKISKIVIPDDVKERLDDYIEENIKLEKSPFLESELEKSIKKILRSKRVKTRFLDKNNDIIRIGDVIHVQQYSNKSPKSDGQLYYEGIVELNNGEVMVTYYDFSTIGESESIKCFPKKYREIIA